MAIPNEIEIITHKVVMPRVVYDNYFLVSAFWAAMRRAGRFVPFGGGSYMASPFMYRGLYAGAYTPGDEFRPERRQVLSQFVLNPKFYITFAVEQLEDLEVFAKGPAAIFSLVSTDLAAMVLSITSNIAVNFSKSGQGSRAEHLNGWPEWINDGLCPSYDGTVYTSVGGQTRSEVRQFSGVGTTLCSVPRYVGGSDGSLKPLTYDELDRGYLDTCFGQHQPDLGLGSKAVVAQIEGLMQRQQVYVQASDPYYGLYNGIKFKNAVVLHDDLWPSSSSNYGLNTEYGDFRTSAFAFSNAGSTVPAQFARELPANGTTLQVGEVFCWLTTKFWDIILSDSKLFSFGWTGWETAQTNLRAVGKMPAALNVRCNASRHQKQFFGIAA